MFSGDLPKKVIEDSLRDELHRGGCDRLEYWSDDRQEEDVEVILTWATAQVAHHWAEMFTREVNAGLDA